MSPVERFTRDGASKYVWAVLALAALLGFAYAYTAGGKAVDDERAGSQRRAVEYVNQVLAPRVAGQDLATPVSGLDSAVRRSILSDARVSRVRVWSADGALLFSTDASDRPGSNAGLNDPLLRLAEREGPITRSDFSDTGGTDDPERSLLRTYVPLGTTSVAEVDQTEASTVGPVRTEWLSYEILAGGLLVLFLLMAGLSLREPIEPINVGVPFADSSIPAGFSLIDEDRLYAVQEVYRLASERVTRLQEKLEESEVARRRLEGEIQQALSKAGAGAPRPAAATPPVDAPPVVEPSAPAPTPAPTVVQVPESEVVVTSPRGEAWAAAPAGPLARAARDQKTVPVTSRKKKPAVAKPKRAPKKVEKPAEKAAPPQAEAAKPRPAPEPERRPEPERGVDPERKVEPERSVDPERRVEPERSAEPEPKVAATVSAPKPAPVAARAQAPARTRSAPATPQADDATAAHAAALETFIRLTESDRQPHDTTPVDQGAVRAALARTAARKKPGGERLQLPETHGESLGGPPSDSEERS